MSKNYKSKNKCNQPNTELENEQSNPSNEQKPTDEVPTNDEYMSDNTQQDCLKCDNINMSRVDAVINRL